MCTWKTWRLSSDIFLIVGRYCGFPKSPPSTGPFEPTHLLLSNPFANFRQIRHFRQIRRFCQIRRFPRGPLGQLSCFHQTLSQSSAKFAAFAKFVAFHGLFQPTHLLLSNPLANTHQIHQTRCFHQIRRFREGPSTEIISLVKPFGKFSPNSPLSPFSPNLPLSMEICPHKCFHGAL